ncbi:hypothetical protein BWI17_18205 [Betaproteobacteria bacterium GR16-43]|nr:hypothetical protein BWI17_18205 [Betaproteobacteria bacterium GR16-43]
MLYDFLRANRLELLTRCRAKAARRSLPDLPAVTEYGVPQFLAQLIETLREEQTPEALARHRAAGYRQPSLSLVPPNIPGTAAKHGLEMRRQGLPIDQVVHNYGDLCQALTELALEMDEPISVDEFHTFNRCLDDAIADAVTGYEHGKPAPSRIPDSPVDDMHRLVETAIRSFEVIRSGDVALKGATSALHERSLIGLRDLLVVVQARSHPDSAEMK